MQLLDLTIVRKALDLGPTTPNVRDYLALYDAFGLRSFTASEATDAMNGYDRQIMVKRLKQMCDRKLVNREVRKTAKRGRPVYIYSLCEL
jgi:predicted transcriptional regulator